MCKRNIDPPAAMLDANGTLLTLNGAIKVRALEVYTQRLKGNKIGTHLEDHEKDVNKLCAARLKLCKLKKVRPWTMEELNLVIKDLDIGKSRGAFGYANELLNCRI